jgi:hypothetical protein
MRIPLSLAVLVAFVFGCGGGPCKPRTGQYVFKMVQRSGNCGAMPETIVDLTPGASSPDSSCTYKTTESDDKCEVQINNTCGAAGSTFVGTVHWDEDGNGGSGTMAINYKDAPACMGSYDLAYSRP